jgi:hypothetical protein
VGLEELMCWTVLPLLFLLFWVVKKVLELWPRRPFSYRAKRKEKIWLL